MLRRLLVGQNVSEEVILVITSLIVGTGAGLGAVVFRYLIKAMEWVGYDWLPTLTRSWGKAYIIFVPVIGGLLVGMLVFFFAREAKGHGVPEVMEAVALKGGRIRPIVAVIKSLASSIDIGSGGSVGREGPIVQIGSALGSTIGQWFQLSDERIRNLVACGAAGGIAATFNAPIAGVVFAIEIILGEFSVAYFSTVVISSVTASVIGQAVFGDVPAFPLPTEYHIATIWEFGLYPILGVLAAMVGVLFVRVLYGTEDLFESWKSVPEWVQPAVGGALLGLIALAYPLVSPITWDRLPQIFNVGYEVIGETLQGNVVLGVVILLLFLKLVATALTLGSGGSGGVFAPSLFMGAMLGAGFGVVVAKIPWFAIGPPGAYALVGMAAVFSASAQAPMTAILILFELTGDYRIMLPLMLTVVISTLLARRWMNGESIYTLKLSRRGIRLRAGRDVDVLEGVQVREVMTPDVATVGHDTSLVTFSEILNRRRHRGFPVLGTDGKLWGIVTSTDLERAIQANTSRRAKVTEIGTPFKELVVCYPDESIGNVLIKMGPRGLSRLPVVSRTGPDQLLGLIGHQDVIRAYHVAMARKSELAHRVRRAERLEPQDTEYAEIKLEDGDLAVGSTIRQVAQTLPEDCIIVSIHRDDKIIIPHGDTVLRPADLITIYTRSSLIETLQSQLKQPLIEAAESAPEKSQSGFRRIWSRIMSSRSTSDISRSVEQEALPRSPQGGTENGIIRYGGGNLMSTFFMFGSYTQESINKISAERTEKAAAFIAKHGGEVKAGYALLGKKDLVMIVDLPDVDSAIKVSVGLAKELGIQFSTAPAVTFEKFDMLVSEA